MKENNENNEAEEAMMKTNTNNLDAETANKMIRVGQWQQILVPVDFTKSASAALKYAVQIAPEKGGTITLVHVVEKRGLLSGMEDSNQFHTMGDMKAMAHQRLLEMGRQFIPDTLSWQALILEGKPAERIIYAAANTRADLIIMAKHDSNLWYRLFSSQIANKVTHKANCPVMTIRTQDSREFDPVYWDATSELPSNCVQFRQGPQDASGRKTSAA